MNQPIRDEGITLRQAALVTGFSMLIMCAAAPFANFFVYAKLVVPGNIDQTAQNIVANQGLFVAGIFAFLVNYICDILVAWGLYVLLIPANRSLSLLAAWFRLIYTTIGLLTMFKLVTVLRILTTPDGLTIFGPAQLHAQVALLLDSFRYDQSIAFILFAIHLVLLGYLIYRSGYLPKIVGILLVINGLGWLTDSLRPYLFPTAHLPFLSITFFAELILMLWLLIMGLKLQQPPTAAPDAQVPTT